VEPENYYESDDGKLCSSGGLHWRLKQGMVDKDFSRIGTTALNKQPREGWRFALV
jgi:hypothetical protein